jgi:hypothetical protein
MERIQLWSPVSTSHAFNAFSGSQYFLPLPPALSASNPWIFMAITPYAAGKQET